MTPEAEGVRKYCLTGCRSRAARGYPGEAMLRTIYRDAMTTESNEHPHTQSQPASRRSRRVRYAALTVLLASAAAAGCTSDGTQQSEIGAGGTLPGSDVDPSTLPGLGHVHGLGTNPADDSLMVATHFGLWKIDDAGTAKRVGDAAHDFMGFAVIGNDHFIASGHPNGARSLPPLMGLIESKDGGKTWKSRSLMGDADFHSLRIADDGTYGWNSSNTKIMSSKDHEKWSTSDTETMLLDFVVDPNDGQRMVGTIAESRTDLETHTSNDGGNTWQELDGAPSLIRLAWSDSDNVWGFAPDGTIWRANSETWQWRKRGTAPGGPEAVEVSGDVITVAAAGAISRSRDAGKSWSELYRYGK
jgi:hypothetical protein